MGSWTQIGQDIDGEAGGDFSGYSVSLSGDGTIVAIGAIYNYGGGSSAGHVRVYQNVGNTWTQIGQDIDAEAADDHSGYSVSLSGDGTIVAIGAIFNYGGARSAGHVRVYQNVDNTWTKIGQDIDAEAAYDQFGYSVSLSGDGTIVAIGANLNDGRAPGAGHVRVYQNVDNTWTKIGQDIDGEAIGDQFGYSVSLSNDGTIVAIGAIFNDGGAEDAGRVRVYQNVDNTWTKIGQDIDGEAAYDWSGYSVSLSNDGTIVAIGAIFNDGGASSAGHVRVYQNVDNTWTQIGQDIDGEAGGDQSGYSVSLSGDGTIVAIGAIYNYGGGSSAGHVRVYQNVNGSWTQIGQDIDGEALGDRSGYSVSLSNDGTIVAIGAISNNGTALNAGHVRVYKYLQIPTISNFSIPTKILGNAPFQITQPTSNSSGSFTYASSDTQVAAISGNTITIVGAGTSIITATQEATTNYTSGTITTTFQVNQLSPTITNFSIPTKIFGEAPFQITQPTSNSSGSFTYASSDTQVATISGDIITIVGVGNSTITATQAATNNYASGIITAELRVLENSITNPVNISDETELIYFLNSSAEFSNISSDIIVNNNLIGFGNYKYILNDSEDFIKIIMNIE